MIRVRHRSEPERVAEAWFWEKHGDCPLVVPIEGKVSKAWKRVMGATCKSQKKPGNVCGLPMEVHGVIPSPPEEANVRTGWPVCPGDWIVNDVEGPFANGVPHTQTPVLFERYWSPEDEEHRRNHFEMPS